MRIQDIHRHDQVWAGYKWNSLTGFDAPKLQWDEATVEAVNVYVEGDRTGSRRTYGPVPQGAVLHPGGGGVLIKVGRNERLYITPSRYIESLEEVRALQVRIEANLQKQRDARQDQVTLGREWLIDEMALEIESGDYDDIGIDGNGIARRLLDLLMSDEWAMFNDNDLFRLGRLRTRLLNNDKTEETA